MVYNLPLEIFNYRLFCIFIDILVEPNEILTSGMQIYKKTAQIL